MEKEVKAHTDRVDAGKLICYCETCPGCKSPGRFRLHDRRRRRFRLVVDGCVRLVLSWIVRWKCPSCGKRFTDYPPFALPYKRFLTPLLREKVKAYLGFDQSYRRVVQETGKSIVYDDRQDSALARRGAALAHTTLWRWLSWLAGLKNTLQAASKLIGEKEPGSTLHREVWSVPPQKVRSQKREAILQQAMRCLVVEPTLTRLFGKKIFPDLATAYRWS